MNLAAVTPLPHYGSVSEPVAEIRWFAGIVRSGRSREGDQHGMVDRHGPAFRQECGKVANQYLIADRDQLFLLPPAMRDWLPESHLVWFVLDVVSAIDRTAFHARRVRSGPGRPAYHPDQ